MSSPVASLTESFRASSIYAIDTNANTFGTQQLTLFNAYYGEYCYMPLLLFEGQSGKMILPILRPGRTNKSINISGWLREANRPFGHILRRTEVITMNKSG